MNKTKFRSQSALVLILGFFIMYFYSGLNVDQMNVLTPYYTETYGWQAAQIMAPVTVASLLTIPLGFVVGSLLMKFRVNRVLGLSCVIIGLSTVLLGFSGANAQLYWVALLLVRTLPITLSMSASMLCTNWYVKRRGWSLGVITMGCPLCSATIITVLTFGLKTIGFSATYLIMGLIVVVLGLISMLVLKATPEEVGLYPDGADEAPAVVEDEEGSPTVLEILKNPGTWLLTIAFGFLNWIIGAVMAFYVTTMMISGTAEATYLLWLAVGSILGLPLSYVLGVLDDKIGTVKSTLVLCLFFLIVLLGMAFMKANSIPLIALTAFGIAGMTGGTPNLHPSMTVYVFGRKNFQAANRFIMALQTIISSFSFTFMGAVLDKTGSLKPAYLIMIAMLAVAVVCFLLIGRKPDHDR